MLKKLTAGALIALALSTTAYAATCPSASSFTKKNDGTFKVSGPTKELTVDVDPASTSESAAQALKFTAARIKDKDSNDARVVCQYEDGKMKPDVAASLVWPTGKPTAGDGGNWQGDDCATEDGDVQKCAFK
ncbi:hypothetical protein [Pseudomonas fluorescens]|jgi:hypothetical protein|uniref:hypothetical protein n=1 Tax=Pseudomonas fluorescens TaxID=294 RepID=UPI00054C3BEA|nr:hypothetical protein [Pseudomonas fluorescens]KII31709.1 hypothetical protein RY26_21205 [Pseudomonas fluorescens]